MTGDHLQDDYRQISPRCFKWVLFVLIAIGVFVSMISMGYCISPYALEDAGPLSERVSLDNATGVVFFSMISLFIGLIVAGSSWWLRRRGVAIGGFLYAALVIMTFSTLQIYMSDTRSVFVSLAGFGDGIFVKTIEPIR